MAKTILLVEDDDDARQMMVLYLQHLGYRLFEAADGFDAIAFINHQELPDLILMDMSMPVMDGLETIGHIKRAPNTDEIPIICVTSYGNLYKTRAIAAGCKDVVAKPVDFDTLAKVIEQYVAH